MSVCVLAFFSAISKPIWMPFGTKLLFSPGKVLNPQYFGKLKKKVYTRIAELQQTAAPLKLGVWKIEMAVSRSIFFYD